LGQSFFHFKKFSILQQSKGLKVTSDACLLGALATHDRPNNCLDIGTGTGVLALMTAQKFPSTSILAIELEKEVAEQAVYNISQSPFNQQISVINADVLSYGFNSTFDLIICNPPYSMNHLKGSSKEKNTAMHNRTLPFEQLIEKARNLLSPDGLFWCIGPENGMKELANIGERNQLHIIRKIQIHNKPGKYFRTVSCFSLQTKSSLQEENLLMHEEDGSRTEMFDKLMFDFYLENTVIYRRKGKG
jgi:tRNA1Val (adenine37-N6)-methyltransferase